MSLPITLPTGYIAIYGTGTPASPSGIANIDPSGALRWGSVYKVWDGGATYIYGNDNVMFKESDVFCRLAAASPATWVYTVIPARLVTKQEPLL